MRIGQSIDIHPLKAGRALILGGVQIEHDLGLDGHSDADVLCHACMESVLGALALGDLGKHFPDTDPQYRGADSLQLCARVYTMMTQRGYQIGNMDATILIEKPKLAPYIEQMRQNIANVFHCPIDVISIKATRGEKLGFVGHQEGAVCMAVCCLEEKR